MGKFGSKCHLDSFLIILDFMRDLCPKNENKHNLTNLIEISHSFIAT